MTALEHKRKARRKQTAEDFTPPELVNEMLDKLPPELFIDPIKTFIDPAAGNGNFLVEVLRRKLSHNHPPLQALETTFGVELMPDNVEEMRERLLDVLLEHHPDLDDDSKDKAIGILNTNIICHDALTWNFEDWCSAVKTAKPLF